MINAAAENVISQVSHGLDNERDRRAFRKAAEQPARETDGKGSFHRAVRPLWRSFFRPPSDTSDNGFGSNGRPSKLVSGEFPLTYPTKRAAPCLPARTTKGKPWTKF